MLHAESVLFNVNHGAWEEGGVIQPIPRLLVCHTTLCDIIGSHKGNSEMQNNHFGFTERVWFSARARCDSTRLENAILCVAAKSGE